MQEGSKLLESWGGVLEVSVLCWGRRAVLVVPGELLTPETVSGVCSEGALALGTCERGRGKDSHQWFSGCMDVFSHGYWFFPLSDKTWRNSLNSPQHCSRGPAHLTAAEHGQVFQAASLCPLASPSLRQRGPGTGAQRACRCLPGELQGLRLL